MFTALFAEDTGRRWPMLRTLRSSADRSHNKLIKRGKFKQIGEIFNKILIHARAPFEPRGSHGIEDGRHVPKVEEAMFPITPLLPFRLLGPLAMDQ